MKKLNWNEFSQLVSKMSDEEVEKELLLEKARTKPRKSRLDRLAQRKRKLSIKKIPVAHLESDQYIQ